MSFYRKYRPQTIEEIDNSFVKERLTSLLNKKLSDLPHAYLLTGPKGAGKTTVARILAKLFNCPKKNKAGYPCGQCDTCQSITKGNNLDILEIDAASNRGIDEIRMLRERVGLSPVSGAYSVFIIDEVHMLTTEAFNALLKTLEEPPAHAVFILATTDPEKMPATVISRCLELRFGKAGPEELKTAIMRVAGKEGLSVDSDAVTCISQIADGSFRDAVKYLEQVSLEDKVITGKLVNQVLSSGEADSKELGGIIDALLLDDVKKAVTIVSGLTGNGKNPKLIIASLSKLLAERLTREISGTSPDKKKLEKISQLTDLFTEAYSQIRYSPVPVLPLLNAIAIYSLKSHLPQAETSLSGDDSDKEYSGHPVKIPEIPAGKEMPKGNLTLAKLHECWPDVITDLKNFNHSLSGILRSSRPKSVSEGTVVIEAFYKFHSDKLSEARSLEALAAVFKKLFGEKVKIQIVLGKKSG